MTTIEVRDLGHRYPGAARASLRGVSLRVGEGELVAVVGPSGSGKSTLLRVIAGIEADGVDGRVLLDGREVAGVPTERRDLTVMFQSPLLFGHLDVVDNVAFAPRLAGLSRREARRTARRYLELVRLGGFERRPVGGLSGGQQQRVALARALAAQRGALLLDEPFSSLDRELRTSMHDLLAEVRAALAPTILLVTHDLDEAALADSVAVLIDGRLHQHAPMAELNHRPATLAVARLLGGFVEVPGVVTSGAHRSAWGAVPLADGAPTAGEAVLLLRREDLRLQAPGAPGPGTEAVVTGRRFVGTRVILRLATDDGSPLEVELPPGEDADTGSRVRVAPADARAPRWALPPDGATSSE